MSRLRLRLSFTGDRVEALDDAGRVRLTLIAADDGAIEVIPDRGGFASIREPPAGDLQVLRIRPMPL